MSAAEMIRKSIDEHELLQRIIATTQTSLESPIEAAGWLDTLRDTFEHLRAHLIKHFAIEESEGYMIAVTQRRPDKVEQVRRMRDEHVAVTARASEIMTSLREARSMASTQATRIRAEVRSLLDQIRRHEENENRLIQSVFNTDVNGND